jgi:ABC-type amino acid transport substrate-binding protein
MRPWLKLLVATISRQTPAYRAARLTRFTRPAPLGGARHVAAERPLSALHAPLRTRSISPVSWKGLGTGRAAVVITAIFAVVASAGNLAMPSWLARIGPLPGTTTKPVQAQAHLRVGVTDRDSGWSSFDRGLAQALAEDLGMAPDYVTLDDEEGTAALQSGRVDVVARYAMTDTRSSRVAFVGPYLTSSYGALSRSNNDDPFIALQGGKVCTPSGVDPAWQGLQGVTRTNAQSINQCLEKLDDGSVSAVIANRLTLLGVAAAHPGTYVTSGLRLGPDTPYGLALARADKSRCIQLSESLRNILTDGRWEMLFKSAFSEEDPGEYKPSTSTLAGCDW